MNRQANDPPDSALETDKDDLDAGQVVVAYHERTKHYYHHYAASLGYLDWAQQPDPFRRYNGAPLLKLALPDAGRALPYWQLYVPENVAPAPLSVDAISLFFRYALSLTAWKGIEGTIWPLRANPSSGNLHPTEGYVLLPSLDALNNRPGVYHYASKEHGLELRADLDPSVWASLTAGFPEGSFLVGLSSILWREAWKYGERAFRYCQHDVGHALGSMRFAAAALGWKLHLLDHVSSAAVSRLFGLDREADYDGAEREHPELVALVVRVRWAGDRVLCLSNELMSQVSSSRWYGTANVLSPKHGIDWPVIDEVARAITNSGIAADEEFSGFPSEEELFTNPVRSLHCGASDTGAQKRGEHGRDHGDFRGCFFPDDGSSDAHPKRTINAMGRSTLAPTHPPRPLRAPRERLVSRSLHARPGSEKGGDAQASDAARVPVATPRVVSAGTSAFPAERRGLP